MHRVLLREVVIDVPSGELETARTFWGRALAAQPRSVSDHPEFVSLDDAASLCHVGLQSLHAGAGRFHLDIETDDVEGEVARLTRFGATEIDRHRDWVVMCDPTGLRFCIVPPASDEFEARSREVG